MPEESQEENEGMKIPTQVQRLVKTCTTGERMESGEIAA